MYISTSMRAFRGNGNLQALQEWLLALGSSEIRRPVSNYLLPIVMQCLAIWAQLLCSIQSVLRSAKWWLTKHDSRYQCIITRLWILISSKQKSSNQKNLPLRFQKLGDVFQSLNMSAKSTHKKSSNTREPVIGKKKIMCATICWWLKGLSY
jgi:hypothetical protein